MERMYVCWEHACVRDIGVGIGVAYYSLDILCGTIKGLLPQPVRGTNRNRNRTRSRIRLLGPPMISYVHLLLLSFLASYQYHLYHMGGVAA